MKLNKWMILTVMVLSAVLSACERSASKAPVITEEPVAVGNPTATSNPAQIMIAQTQTAASMKVSTSTSTSAPVKEKPSATPKGTSMVEIITTLTPTSTGQVEPTKLVIPTLPRPSTYKLQPNENPYCIARRFNVDIGEVLSMNSLTTSSNPPAGTLLKIPASGHPWSSGARVLIPHPAQYSVRAGDTVYTIACLFGDVSPEGIIAANQLKEPFTLTSGSLINIP